MAREKRAGTSEYKGMILRCIRKYPQRVEEQGVDTDALVQLREIREELEAQTAETVARLREQGYSWQAIADGLGIHKPAAIRKYGSVPVDESKVRKAGGQPSDLR